MNYVIAIHGIACILSNKCTDLIPIQQNVCNNISMFLLNLTWTFPRPFFATCRREKWSGERPIPFLFHTPECWWANQVVLHTEWCINGNNGTQESWVMEAVCRRLKLRRTETWSQEGCSGVSWMVGICLRAWQLMFSGVLKHDSMIFT